VASATTRKLRFKGEEKALAVASGNWDSAIIVGRIAQIILNEGIGIETHLDSRFEGSASAIGNLTGCIDDACYDVREFPTVHMDFENWYTDAGLQIIETHPEVLHAGFTGYKGQEGLYMRQDVADRLWQDHAFLAEYYKSYYHTGHPWTPYFNRTSEIAIPPDSGCRGEAAEQMAKAGMPCSSDGWWYSPACSTDRNICIPVLMGFVGWFGLEAAKVIASNRVPMAISFLSWPDQRIINRSVNALFFWWRPDWTYKALGPVQRLNFPTHERAEWSRGVYKTDFPDFQLKKYMWKGVDRMSNQVAAFFKNFELDWSSMDDLMDQMYNRSGSGETDLKFTLACEWVKDNQETWREWFPEFPACHPGEGFIDNACTPCPAITFSYFNATTGTRLCLPKPCVGLACMSVATFAWGVVATVAGALLLVASAWWVRKRRLAARDSPGDASTAMGSWILVWVGLHLQARLAEATGYGKSWLVNASPFVIVVERTASCRMIESETIQSLRLEPWTYCRAPLAAQTTMHLQISDPDCPEKDWHRLDDVTRIMIKQSEWSQQATEVDCNDSDHVRYVDPTVRKALPPSEDGKPKGSIKLAKGPRGTILFLWSPPHTLRGVPVLEFLQFLNRVIEHPRARDHRLNVRARDCDSTDVNMYDACHYIVMPEAACVDASYAELRTNYGPANVFISHVWAESAVNTYEAINKFHNWTRMQSKTNSCTSDLKSVLLRVWFCTICNNQSRVAEELGSDVYLSPFAQVLRSSSCHQVSLVSPFRALNRKWCNYEFCVASHEGKEVVMLTTEGVVQAGHVPPQTLNELAKTVVNFNCKDATCTSPADEKFIDDAVKQMGGYEHLDAELKTVFQHAIFEAHHYMDQAVACFGQPEEHLRWKIKSLKSLPVLGI
jgi:hypothetical protein